MEHWVVSDEHGKQVCSSTSQRRAVVEALGIAAKDGVAVQVVGSGPDVKESLTTAATVKDCLTVGQAAAMRTEHTKGGE
jgi:hypothetical protein